MKKVGSWWVSVRKRRTIVINKNRRKRKKKGERFKISDLPFTIIIY